MGVRAYIVKKYCIEYAQSLPSFKNDKNALCETLNALGIEFYENEQKSILEISIQSLNVVKARGKYAKEIKAMQEAVKKYDYYKNVNTDFLLVDFI